MSIFLAKSSINKVFFLNGSQNSLEKGSIQTGFFILEGRSSSF